MAEPLSTANPFALMMTPEAVFAAIERSERLGRLKSRICRPLDGPRATQPVAPEAAAPEVQAFDAEIEAAVEPTDWSTEPEVEAIEAGVEIPVERAAWGATQYD